MNIYPGRFREEVTCLWLKASSLGLAFFILNFGSFGISSFLISRV